MSYRYEKREVQQYAKRVGVKITQIWRPAKVTKFEFEGAHAPYICFGPREAHTFVAGFEAGVQEATRRRMRRLKRKEV